VPWGTHIVGGKVTANFTRSTAIDKNSLWGGLNKQKRELGVKGILAQRLNAFVLITFVLKHSFEPLRVLFDFRMILLNRRLV
jgi:hypothetical protein